MVEYRVKGGPIATVDCGIVGRIPNGGWYAQTDNWAVSPGTFVGFNSRKDAAIACVTYALGVGKDNTGTITFNKIGD